MKRMVLPFPSLSVRAVTSAPATLAQGGLTEPLLNDKSEEHSTFTGSAGSFCKKSNLLMVLVFQKISLSMKAEIFQEIFLFFQYSNSESFVLCPVTETTAMNSHTLHFFLFSFFGGGQDCTELVVVFKSNSKCLGYTSFPR